MSDNLFNSNPDARKAVKGATGLSGEALDQVIDNLAEAGLSPALRPNADSHARYAYALSLIRGHGYSLRAAAREAGLDHSNFRKKLIRMDDAIPDAEQRHQAAEERILSLAEDLSQAAGERLIADVEANRLKPADLVKTFSASTNQVAAKRRWSQSTTPSGGLTKNALAEALSKMRITIEPPDPARSAINVTARRDEHVTGENENESKGNQKKG